MRLRAPRNKYDRIMLALGIVAFVLATHGLYWGHASTKWPRQDAVITASKLLYVSKGSLLEVRYEFECGGRRCSGDRWHYKLFADSADDIWLSGRSERMRAAAAAYSVGKHVQVAVKPGDPGESVLEPGMSSDDATVAAVGLALILLSFVGRRSESPGTAAITDRADVVAPEKLAR
jgi:hypothetical protein